MHDDLLALALPFDKSAESNMVKGGTKLTYIPVAEVIYRLNEVLAYNWSYTVISCHRDPLDPDYIVAHVSMKVYAGGDPIIRDGFGGVKVKRTKTGDIVDLGDEYKGAVSDALKKAAQSFGVGLYLARHEDKAPVPTYIRDMSNPTPNPYKGENIKDLFPDAVEVTPDGITVRGNQFGDLPSWCLAECAKNGYTTIYDNRDRLIPDKNRPWFKDVDSGNPIWAPKGTPLPVIPSANIEWDTEEEPF